MKIKQNKRKITAEGNLAQLSMAGSQMNVTFDDLYSEWYESFKMEVDRSPFGCMIINKKGIIEHCNDNMANLFKYDKSEMINLPLNNLIPPNFQNDHINHVNKFFENT